MATAARPGRPALDAPVGHSWWWTPSNGDAVLLGATAECASVHPLATVIVHHTAREREARAWRKTLAAGRTPS